MDFTRSRWKIFLILLVIWGAIYLPGLGRTGLKGEEGRRVLPAIEMLKTGDWIMPRIAGRDYYSKPPGINWLVALSFILTGEQSELTARLPSVVFILLFVTLLVWLPGKWLSEPARLISAIIFLTNIAVIEKGRLIEIEAVYISLTGIALLLWLSVWVANGPGWLLWSVPSVVLAFGLLVKGPFILIFFYSVVISVLAYSRKLRSLFSVWHIIGVCIISLPFFVWLWLAFQQTPASKMMGQMSSQLLIRIIAHFDILYWGQNVVRALIVFLPWLLFVPMLWDKSQTPEVAGLPLYRGCRLGIVIGFIAIILMPKMEARYTMPVIPLTCVLLGWSLSLRRGFIPTDRMWKNVLLGCLVVSCLTAVASVIFVSRSPATIFAFVLAFCATGFVFWKRNEIQNVLKLTLVTALVFVVGVLQFSSYGLDITADHETRRPAATAINNAVPAGQIIYIYKPTSYLYPAFFRLRNPFDYVFDANDINEQARYLLIKKKDMEVFKADGRITAPEEVLYKLPDKIPGEFVLVKLGQTGG